MLVTCVTLCALRLLTRGPALLYNRRTRQGRRWEDTMNWNELCRPVRLAILREAVRRGVNVEDLFAALGGAR